MFKRKATLCAAVCLCAALLFSAYAAGSAGTGGADADPAASAEQMLAGIAGVPAWAALRWEAEHEPGTGPAADPEEAPQAESSEEGPEVGQPAAPAEAPAEAQEPAQDPLPPPAQPSPETPSPAEAPSQTEKPAAITARPILTSGSVVPAQAEPVDTDYFDDAAFIGNSLAVGFHLYSGVNNMDYYAATSMTIFGIGDYITQMASVQYGKIYMLLGINELTYNLDKLMTTYGNVLDRLMGDHPGALIYVMGVSPVSAAKDASSKSFTMANVNRFNDRLLQLVEEKGCYYIDLCDALAGEDGFLPSDVTTDGIHFKVDEYKVWLNYLCSHYVPTEEPSETPEPEPEPEPMTEPEPEFPPEPAAEYSPEAVTEPAPDLPSEPAVDPTSEFIPEAGTDPAEAPAQDPAETEEDPGSE